MSYKLQDDKNPASFLKSIQNVGFEQTATKFIGSCFFWVYQIAILECNEIVLLDSKEWFFSWKEIMIRTVKFPYQSHAKYGSY